MISLSKVYYIFDYNPLLIYLYSPQREQISLSALFTFLEDDPYSRSSSFFFIDHDNSGAHQQNGNKMRPCENIFVQEDSR